MKLEFEYSGLKCSLVLEEAEDTEVNPIPILKAVINLYDSISYFHSFDLTLTSKDNDE